MQYQFEGISINIEDAGKRESDIALLFIHGFTGSGEDWYNIKDSFPGMRLLLVDLPGHGMSDSTSDLKYYTQDNLVRMIEDIRENLELKKLILVGYSLGGRLALSYAAIFPENLYKLIVESGQPGLTSEDDRTGRVKEDEELADYIAKNEIDNFVDFWMSKDIFRSENNLLESERNEIRNRKLKNNNTGLSNMLRGFSLGRMRPLWGELGKIRCKTLLIAGELDKKYCELNKKVQSEIKNSRFEIVAEAGHNVHLEKREEFIRLINGFINDHEEKQ